MEDYINDFMKQKIGIDVKTSNPFDIQILSDYIDQYYSDKINYDECGSLKQYFNELIDEDWTVCLFEPSMKVFNAYRNESDESYRKHHKVISASEFFNGMTDFEIDENEITNLVG